MRFGVLQEEKVRPIDNFRGSFVNAACGVSEKVEVDSVDRILEAILACLSARLPASPHPRLVGRTWDLKSAYKQLAVRADHRDLAWIAVHDPEANAVRCAQMNSMPFGAVASVHAFLRCSEALKAVARQLFLLVATSYFDDFTIITTADAADYTSPTWSTPSFG